MSATSDSSLSRRSVVLLVLLWPSVAGGVGTCVPELVARGVWTGMLAASPGIRPGKVPQVSSLKSTPRGMWVAGIAALLLCCVEFAMLPAAVVLFDMCPNEPEVDASKLLDGNAKEVGSMVYLLYLTWETIAAGRKGECRCRPPAKPCFHITDQ